MIQDAIVNVTRLLLCVFLLWQAWLHSHWSVTAMLTLLFVFHEISQIELNKTIDVLAESVRMQLGDKK